MTDQRAPSFTVIGAGINGAAGAYEIIRRFTIATVTVFEKADTGADR